MSKTKEGIELSPKYGVNPSMDMCFWCGQPKGLLLLGRMRGKDGSPDVEAPKSSVTSLEPCDSCKETFKKGVLIVEVIDDGSRFSNDVRFAIKDEHGKVKWPTGRFVLMNPSSVNGGEAGAMMLCDPGVMDKIFESADKAKAKEEAEEKPKAQEEPKEENP